MRLAGQGGHGPYGRDPCISKAAREIFLPSFREDIVYDFISE